MSSSRGLDTDVYSNNAANLEANSPVNFGLGNAANSEAHQGARAWSWSWAWTPPSIPGTPDAASLPPDRSNKLRDKFSASSKAIAKGDALPSFDLLLQIYGRDDAKASVLASNSLIALLTEEILPLDVGPCDDKLQNNLELSVRILVCLAGESQCGTCHTCRW